MEQMIENSHCWEQQGILDYFYQSLIGDLLGDKHSRSEFGRAREKLIKVHGSHTKGVSRLSLSEQWCWALWGTSVVCHWKMSGGQGWWAKASRRKDLNWVVSVVCFVLILGTNSHIDLAWTPFVAEADVELNRLDSASSVLRSITAIALCPDGLARIDTGSGRNLFRKVGPVRGRGVGGESASVSVVWNKIPWS